MAAVIVRSGWYEFIVERSGLFPLDLPANGTCCRGDATVRSSLHYQGYTHALSCRSLPRDLGSPWAGIVQVGTLSIHEHKHTFGFG